MTQTTKEPSSTTIDPNEQLSARDLLIYLGLNENASPTVIDQNGGIKNAKNPWEIGNNKYGRFPSESGDRAYHGLSKKMTNGRPKYGKKNWDDLFNNDYSDEYSSIDQTSNNQNENWDYLLNNQYFGKHSSMNQPTKHRKETRGNLLNNLYSNKYSQMKRPTKHEKENWQDLFIDEYPDQYSTINRSGNYQSINLDALLNNQYLMNSKHSSMNQPTKHRKENRGILFNNPYLDKYSQIKYLKFDDQMKRPTKYQKGSWDNLFINKYSDGYSTINRPNNYQKQNWEVVFTKQYIDKPKNQPTKYQKENLGNLFKNSYFDKHSQMKRPTKYRKENWDDTLDDEYLDNYSTMNNYPNNHKNENLDLLIDQYLNKHSSMNQPTQHRKENHGILFNNPYLDKYSPKSHPGHSRIGHKYLGDDNQKSPLKKPLVNFYQEKQNLYLKLDGGNFGPSKIGNHMNMSSSSLILTPPSMLRKKSEKGKPYIPHRISKYSSSSNDRRGYDSQQPKYIPPAYHGTSSKQKLSYTSKTDPYLDNLYQYSIPAGQPVTQEIVYQPNMIKKVVQGFIYPHSEQQHFVPIRQYVWETSYVPAAMKQYKYTPDTSPDISVDDHPHHPKVSTPDRRQFVPSHVEMKLENLKNNFYEAYNVFVVALETYYGQSNNINANLVQKSFQQLLPKYMAYYVAFKKSFPNQALPKDLITSLMEAQKANSLFTADNNSQAARRKSPDSSPSKEFNNPHIPGESSIHPRPTVVHVALIRPDSSINYDEAKRIFILARNVYNRSSYSYKSHPTNAGYENLVDIYDILLAIYEIYEMAYNKNQHSPSEKLIPLRRNVEDDGEEIKIGENRTIPITEHSTRPTFISTQNSVSDLVLFYKARENFGDEYLGFLEDLIMYYEDARNYDDIVMGNTKKEDERDLLMEQMPNKTDAREMERIIQDSYVKLNQLHKKYVGLYDQLLSNNSLPRNDKIKSLIHLPDPPFFNYTINPELSNNPGIISLISSLNLARLYYYKQLKEYISTVLEFYNSNSLTDYFNSIFFFKKLIPLRKLYYNIYKNAIINRYIINPTHPFPVYPNIFVTFFGPQDDFFNAKNITSDDLTNLKGIFKDHLDDYEELLDLYKRTKFEDPVVFIVLKASFIELQQMSTFYNFLKDIVVPENEEKLPPIGTFSQQMPQYTPKFILEDLFNDPKSWLKHKKWFLEEVRKKIDYDKDGFYNWYKDLEMENNIRTIENYSVFHTIKSSNRTWLYERYYEPEWNRFSHLKTVFNLVRNVITDELGY